MVTAYRNRGRGGTRPTGRPGDRCRATVTLSTSLLLTGSTSRRLAASSGASGDPGRSFSSTGTTTSVSNAVDNGVPVRGRRDRRDRDGQRGLGDLQGAVGDAVAELGADTGEAWQRHEVHAAARLDDVLALDRDDDLLLEDCVGRVAQDDRGGDQFHPGCRAVVAERPERGADVLRRGRGVRRRDRTGRERDGEGELRGRRGAVAVGDAVGDRAGWDRRIRAPARYRSCRPWWRHTWPGRRRSPSPHTCRRRRGTTEPGLSGVPGSPGLSLPSTSTVRPVLNAAVPGRRADRRRRRRELDGRSSTSPESAARRACRAGRWCSRPAPGRTTPRRPGGRTWPS